MAKHILLLCWKPLTCHSLLPVYYFITIHKECSTYEQMYMRSSVTDIPLYILLLCLEDIRTKDLVQRTFNLI